MRNIKKIFAILLAVMAVMLMQTAVFASVYKGMGKSSDTIYLSGDITAEEVQAYKDDDTVTKVKISSNGAKFPANSSGMFTDFQYIKNIDLTGADTSAVTNMHKMFYACTAMTSLDVSGFNTENVKDMGYMFQACYALTSLDVSNFDTSNVTNMNGVFQTCKNLTSINVGNFNTSNVTEMAGMFECCYAMTSLDVSNFDTSKVTNMNGMFSLSNFDTLDLSNFDTSKVKYMENMFYKCSNLTTLDISSFDMSNVTQKDYMFTYDNKLVELKLGSGVVITRYGNLKGVQFIGDNGTSTTVENGYSTISPTEEAMYYRKDYVDGYINAMQGSGTKDDPYIVTDYNALRFIFLLYDDNSTTPLYIKLGSDIKEERSIYVPIKKQNKRTVYLDLNNCAINQYSAYKKASSVFEITGGELIINDSGKSGNIYVSNNSPSIDTFNIASKKSMAKLTINGGSFYQINGKIIYMDYEQSTDKATPYVVINNGYFLAYGDGIYIKDGKLMLYDGDFSLTNIYVSANSVNKRSSFIRACDVSSSGKIYSNKAVLFTLLNEGKSKVQINKGNMQTVDISASEITGNHIKVIYTASTATIKTAKVITSEPVVGDYLPSSGVPDDYSDFTITAYGWDPNGIKFQSGKVYTVSVTLKANNYFTFGESTEFYVNNNKAYIESIDGDTAKIYYVFTKKGDVNLDSFVNDADAAYLLKYLSGNYDLTDVQIEIAKINNDDKVDMLDVIAILNS